MEQELEQALKEMRQEIDRTDKKADDAREIAIRADRALLVKSTEWVGEYFSKRDALVAFLCLIFGFTAGAVAMYHYHCAPLLEEVEIFRALNEKGK